MYTQSQESSMCVVVKGERVGGLRERNGARLCTCGGHLREYKSKILI